MKYFATLTLLLISLSFAQDEFAPQGSYFPNFFSELIDAEVYNYDIVYIVGVGGFIFMDMSTLANPTFISRYNPGSIYIRFYNGKAAGDLAVGAARLDGLYFIDIHNLAQPALHSIYQYSGYSYESVEFYQDYAYAAAHEAGLEIISISDPGTPTHLNTITGLSNVWDVFIHEDYLYVTAGTNGLQIYSLAQPDNPALISTIALSGFPREVKVVDDKAFVALGASGFDIVEVADPANPYFVSHFDTRFGIVNHLEFANNTVFTAAWELVSAVDISDPLQPRLIATEDTPIRAMGIAADSNRIFVADWGAVRTYLFENNLQPDIHVKPVSYDFGFVAINFPISKDFDVYNLGESDLDIFNIFSTHTAFTVNPVSLLVPPGGKKTVTVTFTPPVQMPYFEQIKFASNDVDESEKRINVYGGVVRPTPGSPAPPFTLSSITGTTVSLSDFLGKVVILAFFASW